MSVSERLSILAVVQYGYDAAPAQRYRIEEWQPLLESNHGIDITYTPFIHRSAYEVFIKPGHVARKVAATVGGVARRLFDVARARKWDCVYILREAAAIGPALFEPLFASRIPYVFDFDDAIFLPQVSSANRTFAFTKSFRKVSTICRLAAHVTAGNEYLASWARQRNDKVTVIPTTVDTDRYIPRPRPANDIPVIGWSGSLSTAVYLRELREVFSRLAETHRFRLRIMGAPDFEPPSGVDTDLVAWTSESEIDQLSMMDIGLMPLPDDAWARGKCGLKALLHMSLAEPVVCSPIGVNSEIVNHGVNGFLASTPAEWLARLRELLDSAELRRGLGTAGRETILERYSARSQVPRLAEIFRSVIRSRRRLSAVR
jgi:glycosyltransferase involved in cell wall biosynthesis